MFNDQDITTTVKAVDQATPTLNKVGQSLTGLTGSVFKGVAAWDVLKKGIQVATNFMEQSVGSFLDAQKKLDLTRATVESMGISFDSVKDQLDTFGKSMSALGVDNDDATNSAAKLAKAAGGDLTKGMQLAKLASDLTSSGFNDFSTNVDNLTRVLSGKGQRALLDYRINLDDNATTAEQLAAVQAKVTQTTEDYANTAPGQIAVVEEAYKQFQQSLGSGFVSAIEQAITGAGGLHDALGGVADVGKQVGPVIYSLTSFAIALAQGFILTGQSIAAAGLALNDFSKIRKGDAQAIAEVNAASDQVKATFDAMKQSITNALNPVDGYNKAMSAMSDTTKKTADQTKTSFATIANANTAAGASADKLMGKYGDLAAALTKVRQEAVDDLASISKAHNDAVNQSQQRISDLRQSLSDLSASYAKTAADAQKAFNQQAAQDTSSVADAVVAEQQKIADLKNQAGMETDPHQKILLQQQLKTEQDAYAGQADFIASIQDQVDAAKVKASETDFERAIDDYKAKRAQAQQEFDDNRADAAAEYAAKQLEINKEIQQEQDKMAQESAEYTTAYTSIQKTVQDANALVLDTTKQTTDQVIALVDAQITKYNNLADAIARASQGKPTQVQQVSTASLPIREHGGIVPGPTGMPIPIIAHGQERVIPASGAAKAGTVSPYYQITINNPQVGNTAGLTAFTNQLNKAMRDLTRNHKLNAV